MQVLNLCVDLDIVAIDLDVDCAGIDCAQGDIIRIGQPGIDDDLPDVVEHPAHTPAFAKGAAGARKNGTHLGNGTISIICHRLNHQGDASRTVALVEDLIVVVAAGATGRAFDRA